MKKTKGFTLPEMLLSIAAIMIIGGTSIPVYQSFQVRNDLDIAAVTIAQSWRRAQMLAQLGEGDTGAGVKVEPGNIILFRGTSYLGRDQALDEIFEMPLSITESGVSEVIFSKFTGVPSLTGSVVLTTYTNETRTLTINSKGMVSY